MGCDLLRLIKSDMTRPSSTWLNLTFLHLIVLQSILHGRLTSCALSVWMCDIFYFLYENVLHFCYWFLSKVWWIEILLEMKGRCLSSMWMCCNPDAGVIYIFLLSCPGWCLAEYIRIAKYEKVLILSFIKCWSHVLIAGCVAESAESCWLTLAASLGIFGKAAVFPVSEGCVMAPAHTVVTQHQFH